jgi:hypothetical protein
MSADSRPPGGDALLFAVGDRSDGRVAPALLPLLAFVLGGIYTDVEKDDERAAARCGRKGHPQHVQNVMQHKVIDAVQRLSGRVVSRSSPTATSAPTSRSSCSCSTLRHHPRSSCSCQIERQ